MSRIRALSLALLAAATLAACSTPTAPAADATIQAPSFDLTTGDDTTTTDSRSGYQTGHG